ncbi:MAG: adenylyl-sulfate kinase, partial [Elsteraceae bacterium]
LLTLVEAPPSIGRRLSADLIWMGEVPCKAGDRRLLKIGGMTIGATIVQLHGALDLERLTLETQPSLSMNQIGKVTIETDGEIAFDRYDVNRTTGGFILIDRETCDTVAAGMIAESVGPSPAAEGEPERLTAAARADLAGQTPMVLWLTGLSGAGKSTIAELLERRLAERGLRAMRLDGDDLRTGLNADLGFDAASRRENVRRVGEVAKLMHDAGLIVIVSLISPFRADRARAGRLLPQGRFLEIFVDAPLDVCQSRDPKGLYARAATGALSNMTGLDQAYEAPLAPALRLRTDLEEPAQSVDRLLALLQSRA